MYLSDVRFHSLSLRFVRKYYVRLSLFLSVQGAEECYRHSLCTTEFIGARTVYEWVCDSLERYKPQQSEYGRLNLEGTVMSKRKLLRLVKEGHVNGWDDPR